MSEKKTFWIVSSSIDDRGRCAAGIVGTIEAAEKPESGFDSTSRIDVYIDYFDTREEAEQFVEDYKKA